MSITKPSLNMVKKCQHKWKYDEQLEHYRAQQAVLDSLYKCSTYGNDKLEHILLKVTVLNDFCSNHNPNALPIYDRFVAAMLKYFRNEYNFSDFKNDDLKNYGKFKRVIQEFQNYFKLEDCSLIEIDRYLWLLGKDAHTKGLIKA